MDGQLINQFSAWMAQKEAEFIEDLRLLIKIPSVSDKTGDVKPFGKPCIDVLSAALDLGKKYGFEVRNYENYAGCIFFSDEDTSRKTVGLWGHLDVVPAGTNWSFEPFECIQQENFLIGRGVKDNKGPCVASLYLMRFIKETGLDLGYNLRLFLGCDEESGMVDLKYFTDHYKAPDLSLVPDSSFPLCFAEKGIVEAVLASNRKLSSDVIDFTAGAVTNIVPDRATLTLKKTPELLDAIKRLPGEFELEITDVITITAHGSARHTARPEGGINAAFLIADAVTSLGILSPADCDILKFQADVNRDFYGTGLGIDCEDDISGKLTCVGSVTRVRDGFPTLLVNIRYPVRAKGEDVWTNIQAACAKNDYSAEFLRDSKPNYFPLEDPVIEALLTKYRELTGDEADPSVMAGGTYARMLPRAFAFGMGGLPEKKRPDFFKEGNGNAHEADEYLDLNCIKRAMGIYIECLAVINGTF